MNLKEGFEHFLNSERYKELANTTGAVGTRHRMYKNRFNQNKLTEAIILELLIENGYKVKKSIVVVAPRKGKKVNKRNMTHSAQIVNLSMPLTDRAMFWLRYGSKGCSSEEIWQYMMGDRHGNVSHPHDIDDFGRCYGLLQFVPEWEKELYKLKPISKQWGALALNWERLTELYEAGQVASFNKYMSSLINR